MLGNPIFSVFQLALGLENNKTNEFPENLSYFLIFGEFVLTLSFC